MLRYKAVQPHHYAILELLPDSNTNETRTVVDSDHARYRADKVFVLDIIDVFNEQNHLKESFSWHMRGFKYKVGEICSVNDFNHAIENICTTGIHYFKTKEAAISFCVENKCLNMIHSWPKNKEFKIWGPDGTLMFHWSKIENTDWFSNNVIFKKSQ